MLAPGYCSLVGALAVVKPVSLLPVALSLLCAKFPRDLAYFLQIIYPLAVTAVTVTPVTDRIPQFGAGLMSKWRPITLVEGYFEPPGLPRKIWESSACSCLSPSLRWRAVPFHRFHRPCLTLALCRPIGVEEEVEEEAASSGRRPAAAAALQPEERWMRGERGAGF